MKKITFFVAAMFALAANAEVITLDLTTATNSVGDAIQYETKDLPVLCGNLKDVMDSTFSTSGEFASIECNRKSILFQHLPSGDSYGGTYWEGFTLSKVAADTLNQFACMAKGGLKGEGTPFVVGYYSEYYNNPAAGAYSNLVAFFGKCEPIEVYICQSAYTYHSITNGDAYAKKFTDKDTLSLIIEAYDADKDTLTNKVVYHLAVDGKFNKGWEKVDLSSLGLCDGLVFSFKSTDCSIYGGVSYINTPAYFALDGLKVIDNTTALHRVNASSLAVYTNNGSIEVENATAPIEIYTLQGFRLLTTTESHIDISAWPAGIYLLKCGNEAVKVVR